MVGAIYETRVFCETELCRPLILMYHKFLMLGPARLRLDQFFDRDVCLATIDRDGWFYCSVCRCALFGRCTSGQNELGVWFRSCYSHRSVNRRTWARLCFGSHTMRVLRKLLFEQCIRSRPHGDMFLIVDVIETYVFGLKEDSSFVDTVPVPSIGMLPSVSTIL